MWYVKVYIFRKCIQYTIHWGKTQILKKFPSDKINGTKNALFFLLRAPTHHSLTFNLRFLFELHHKVCLSKTVCGIFCFQFRFIFITSAFYNLRQYLACENLFKKMKNAFYFTSKENKFSRYSNFCLDFLVM